MQLTVEKCTSICIDTLQKALKKDLIKNFPGITSEDLFQRMTAELKRVSLNDQIFKYETLENYLGGHRWFFLCPKCNRRASKLFLPPPGYNREYKYACKLCHRLRNQSALEGPNSMYNKVTRPLKRLKEIEEKISRGHLKSSRIQELLSEYDAIEEQLKAAPEFRLYSFKKTHNLI